MSDGLPGRSKRTALYYAIAAIVVVVAIGVGWWYLADSRSGITSGESKTEIAAKQAGADVAAGVSATDADMERLTVDAEKDLVEMERILAEVDAVDASADDNDLSNVNNF